MSDLHRSIDGTVTAVTVVIADRFPLLSLSICTETLRLANRESGEPVFTVRIATPDGNPVRSSSGIELTPDAAVGDIARAQVILVLTSYDPEAACMPEVLSWLRTQERRGALIGCADTGAYVLARAGILHGRHVAVHHETLAAYRETFGEEIVSDRLYAEEGGLMSSGGGMATFDMLLRLVERTYGRGLSDRIAHIMNYRRLPQDARSADGGQAPPALTDRRLGRMIELMQTNMEVPMPIADMCSAANIDGSTARRMFQRHFGASPYRYYLDLRLHRARELVINTVLPIADVGRKAGFADPSAFARAYQNRFTVLPSRERRLS